MLSHHYAWDVRCLPTCLRAYLPACFSYLDYMGWDEMGWDGGWQQLNCIQGFEICILIWLVCLCVGVLVVQRYGGMYGCMYVHMYVDRRQSDPPLIVSFQMTSHHAHTHAHTHAHAHAHAHARAQLGLPLPLPVFFLVYSFKYIFKINYRSLAILIYKQYNRNK